MVLYLKSLDYKTLQKAHIKEKAYISKCQATLLKAQMLLFWTIPIPHLNRRFTKLSTQAGHKAS